MPEQEKPTDFQECVDKGGEVKTEKPSETTYQRVCIIDGQEFRDYIRYNKRKPRRT